MIAVDPPVRLLIFPLASEGPFSNRDPPVNSFLLALKRFGRISVSQRK
jgi:hypothetical protein